MLVRALLVFLVSAGSLFASEVPDWVKRGKAGDKTYKYYVGRSSGSGSEQAGIGEATREAYEQAIRENFGFQTRIQTDAYESTKKVVSTKRVQVLSQDIRVYGFEQIDFYSVPNGTKFDVWVLYRYPLAEISREKSRVASARETAAPEFSEQGTDSAGQKSGTLEISTTPAGASIYIDGNAYGVAPMRLRGVVEAGSHQLRLDHPSFETVNEVFVLVPGKTVRVEKTLVPAMAKMSLTSEPPNANVVINGQQMGTTPLPVLEVPANKSLKIELTHAEASPFATEIEVAKDEFNAKHFELPLKNASLIVRTTPPGAEVWIDGERAGYSPAGPKTLSAGKHEVRVRKQGFHWDKRAVVLRGGEKRTLDDFKLVLAKDTKEPAVWAEMTRPAPARRASEETAFLLSFWLPQYRSSTTRAPQVAHASWGMMVTLLATPFLGLEFGYLYGARSTLKSHRFHFGMPFVFYRSPNQHFYFAGDLDFVFGRDTSLTGNQNQTGAGFSLGYRHWWGKLSRFGFGFRTGAMSYGDSKNLTGIISYHAGLECLALF